MRQHEIERVRRSLLKAVGLTAAAVLGGNALRRPAAAQQFLPTDSRDVPTYKDDTAAPASLQTDSSSAGTESSSSKPPPPKDPPTRDPGSSKACFLRGSRILTADGYRQIEALRVGDQVATKFRGLSRIAAIRSFTLERTGPAGSWPGASRPVRVKAGALGENRPHADLCLTGSHALFIAGALVPAVNLVNGTSIVFEAAEGQATLDFFHVVLEGHDVLDAEGAACESWRDAAAEEPCVPLLSFRGGRDELRSRLRSAASVLIDRRRPLDIIRDDLEERGAWMARAA